LVAFNVHSPGYIDRFLSEEEEQEAVEIGELESMRTEPACEEKERIRKRLLKSSAPSFSSMRGPSRRRRPSWGKFSGPKN
jgi:hypothetical protein